MSNWIEALREYTELREEIARNEETGDCACDSYNFHTCQLCEKTDGLAQRQRALMDLWSDTWAMNLNSANVEIAYLRKWKADHEDDTAGQKWRDYEN